MPLARCALQHAREGQLGRRMEEGLQVAAEIAGVENPLQGVRRSVKATTHKKERAGAAQACIAYVVCEIRKQLLNNKASHIQECMDIHEQLQYVKVKPVSTQDVGAVW